MTPVTAADIRSLSGEHLAPCVSLFVPVTPGCRTENVVELQNQIGRASTLLAATTNPEAAARLLAPARRLCAEVAREPIQGHGLAHFASADAERTFALAAATHPLAVVGSVFHIRPLLAEDLPGYYFLLALSRRAARLYRGTCHGLEQVTVPKMPDGLEDALRAHDTDEPLTLHTIQRGRTPEALFHGHGVGIDDRKDDLVRYFRAVDRAIHPILRLETAPLVLAGVEYLFPLYAQANSYSHLHTQGVTGNPDHTSQSDLHRHAWPLVASAFAGPAERAVRQFHQLHGTGRTVTDPAELAVASATGGLEKLLLAPEAGSRGPTSPGDDPANVAAVHVLRHGGTVHLVDAAVHEGRAAVGIRWLPRDRHH